MASGNTLCVFTPLHNQPPATAFATLDLRNAHPVLDFDAAADEGAIFGSVLPNHYAAGGILAILHWTATTATTGDVKWNGQFERMNTDLNSDSFDTALSTTTTTSGTSGIIVTTIITFLNSQIDGLAVGGAFRFKVTRDADVAGDTMAGDAELHRVEMREV